MLVGVLISIMISIVVGVSLIPTIIDSINTAKATANAPAGLSGLLDVLAYVFVAVILLGAVASDKIGAFMGQLIKQTTLIRGKLRASAYANPELKRELNSQMCRDYRGRLQSAGALYGV